jgi:hypothetical protein
MDWMGDSKLAQAKRFPAEPLLRPCTIVWWYSIPFRNALVTRPSACFSASDLVIYPYTLRKSSPSYAGASGPQVVR